MEVTPDPLLKGALLTTSEVMSLLHVTRATLCSLARHGKIPAIKLPDGAYRFRSAEIAAWLEQRRAA